VNKSPVDEWKPQFDRQQSWNTEDFKRRMSMPKMGEVKEGMGTGFTERSGV